MDLGRGTCQSRNLCMRGCAFGAYFSSNGATLIAADHTGNMTLQPDSIVTEIIFDAEAEQGDRRARAGRPHQDHHRILRQGHLPVRLDAELAPG